MTLSQLGRMAGCCQRMTEGRSQNRCWMEKPSQLLSFSAEERETTISGLRMQDARSFGLIACVMNNHEEGGLSHNHRHTVL